MIITKMIQLVSMLKRTFLALILLRRTLVPFVIFWALKLHILRMVIFYLKPSILLIFYNMLVLVTSKLLPLHWNLTTSILLSTGLLYLILCYRQIVGNLVYLTITRPDIAYLVQVVSQFVSRSTSIYWAAILRI